MNELVPCAGGLPPACLTEREQAAQRRPITDRRHGRVRAESLPALVKEVREGQRRESLVWLVLALAAMVLLGLSF
jgi:hypothetical protein